MKYILSNFTLAIIVAVYLFLLLPYNLVGQSDISVIKTKLTNNGYLIEDVVYVKLQDGSSSKFYYNFSKGRTYKIIAFSEDNYVKDMDLLLLDNEGNLIKRDIHYHKQAKLLFNPLKTSEYQLEIKNHNSVSDTEQYLCGVVIAYRKTLPH